MLGYFIDVTSVQADKMPTGDDSPFIHRQTPVSAMRFTIVELGELEGKLAQAGDRALAMELELFEDLVTEATGRLWIYCLPPPLWRGLMFTYRLRCLLPSGTMFARWSMRRRHSMSRVAAPRRRRSLPPAKTLSPTTDLADDQRPGMVTGPNMAGKSTFLRQNR